MKWWFRCRNLECHDDQFVLIIAPIGWQRMKWRGRQAIWMNGGKWVMV